MKKTNLLIAIFFALATAGFAQTTNNNPITTDWSGWTKGARYEGYVIYKDSKDTVKGWIENRNMYDNQDECIFYGQQNDKKPVAKYTPENVKAYGLKGRHYRSILYSGGLVSKKLKFVQIKTDGGITTYSWYADNSETAVYAKESDPNVKPRQHDDFLLKFPAKMSEMVADNAELAKKITDKEKGYGFARFYEIIDEYNKWYANGKK